MMKSVIYILRSDYMEKKLNIFKNILLIISLYIYYYLIFIDSHFYIYDMSYIKCIGILFLDFILLYIYGIIDNKNKTYRRNITIYILLYLISLISITFFIGRGKTIKFYNFWYMGQYEPFHTISSQLKYGSTFSIIKNIVGNSIMLIPLSFLLMVKNKKFNNILRQTIIILPITISIEVLQAFTHVGVFDIDDILLNYLGTIVFTFLITRFSIIDKIRKIFYTDFNINKKIKYILFIIIVIIIFCYNIYLIN